MSSLLNRKAVRQLLLDTAAHTRAHAYERVADSVYAEAETQLRQWARRKIQSQPSKGKTIR